MKRSAYGMVFLVFLFVAAVALGTVTAASADPCALQLGYPIMPISYVNSATQVVVPLSTSCSTQFGNQLFAAGTAYDLTTNTNAASANTVLTSVNGGYTFNGQLGFSLPPSAQGHWLQVSITIFSNQNGNKLTSNGEAFQVNAGTTEVVTTTLTQQVPTEFAPPLSNGGSGHPRYVILGYVAIAAILATVIIVTVALVVYSRQSRSYYTVQPRVGY